MSEAKTIAVPLKCIECGHEEAPTVDADKYLRWKDGEGHVQHMFPELSDDTRELMISSICGKCFDSLFGNEDEEE
jgi:hypothetical protein